MNFKRCKRCLYGSDHPLGLVIDEEGICSGCRIHEEKDSLDWDERWRQLEKLVSEYRSRDSRQHDCIVPVTGAGDSYYIVHLVVNRLKLNPLLVTNNRYYNTALGIRNLANLRRKFNVDILIQNINPNAVKSVIRTTLRKFGSFHWPAIAGQTVFPIRTAVSHKIPLIIWGAHQGLEQVGMFSHLDNVEMTRRYRKDHDLMGYEADNLLSIFDNLTEESIWQYRYPEWRDIDRIGVRGIYLGNYVRWDPIAQHKEMVKTYDFGSAKMERTFDIYDHVDDWHYTGLHDEIKYIKHGYSKVVDQACREIRHGRITRENAISAVQYYQKQRGPGNELLFEWLNIPKDTFTHILKNHESDSKNKESRSDMSYMDLRHKLELKPNNELSRGKEMKHIVIGKGYP